MTNFPYQMPSVDTPDVEFLRGYARIDDDEDARLRAHGATIPPEERQAFSTHFYAHLRAIPELAAMLDAEPGRAERLQRSQAHYLDELLTAPIDERYILNRVLTGQAHHRIGLLPRWYLGAYSVFVDWWIPRLAAAPDGPGLTRAFLKRILLDTVLAMESYVTGRVESLDREVKDRAQRLDESERRYEDLVENAPEMIHQVDGERRFLGVNRTELARLGYTLEEMKQMTLEMIVPSAYRHGVIEHVERVKKEGKSRLETVFRTKAGEEFPVEMSATAQLDPAGRFLQTRAFVRDLSDRRRLEGELARWERLATVGSMAAKVAHEIRNPLSAISLNVELMGDEMAALPPERRKEVEPLLATILAGVDRLNAITEEYLSFARLPPMEVRETSLQEVFYRLAQLVKPDMDRRGITFVVDLADDIPGVAGDSNQLGQVFLNLIRNSTDAMPEGGQIRVSGQSNEEGTVITVADNGVGIPEKSLAKIFDPFFTTKDAGTGLGLAYVEQVLLEHRARITCKSKVNEGTEFRITFPPATSRPGSFPRGRA